MRYSLVWGLLFACAIALPTRAGSVEATVDGTKIELVGPKGYCALSEKNAVDAKAFALLWQTYQGRIELLAIFTPCDLFKEWRAGKTDRLGQTFQYAVSLEVKDKLLNPSAVADLCRTMRRPDPRIAKESRDLAAETLEKIPQLSKRIDASSLQINGVLHEDNTGCYIGQTIAAKDVNGVDMAVAGVTGITVVKNKMLTIQNTGVFKDRDTVKRMLALTRKTLAALQERNR